MTIVKRLKGERAPVGLCGTAQRMIVLLRVLPALSSAPDCTFAFEAFPC